MSAILWRRRIRCRRREVVRLPPRHIPPAAGAGLATGRFRRQPDSHEPEVDCRRLHERALKTDSTRTLRWHLRTFFAGLGKPDGDRLFAANHLVVGFSALELATFVFVHCTLHYLLGAA